MSGGCRALVFGRFPTPGVVKTRLARGVGNDAACTFYAETLLHTLAQAAAWLSAERDVRCSVTLCYSDSRDAEALEHWLSACAPELGCRQSLGDSSADACAPRCIELVAQAQHSQGLGCRLRCAVAEALVHTASALVVGSDVPDLSADVMRDAARALATYDVVFGSAVDGGYYLVGVSCARALDVLFDDSKLQWSTATVLASSLALALEAGLRVAPLDTLPTLLDVDTRQDLQAWVSRSTAAHPLHAHACAALEAAMGLDAAKCAV